MRAAVLGATGYAGMVLLRLLTDHPQIDGIVPVSSSQPGTPLLEYDPGLSEQLLEKSAPWNSALTTVDEAVKAQPDVVFSALPHLTSAEVCEPFYPNAVVIDLSADFRIGEAALFEQAYGAPPPRADLLPRAVYGLTEWYRRDIVSADIIANPGCYPTASLLPLLPLLAGDIISTDVAISAMSGISGAGRKARQNMLFGERSENVNAYSPGKTHRHWSEIHHHLERTGRTPDVLFTPHLVPVKQGIAVTTVCRLVPGRGSEDVQAALQAAYAQCPFIRIVKGRIPETRDVRNSNRCDISWKQEGDRLLLFSVIDNLVKGASGQAVQNMNVRFGLEETAGLRRAGEF